MSARSFLDTNVWIYAAGGEDEAPAKKARALDIIAGEDLGVSTQVVGEFVNAARKPNKARKPMSQVEAALWVDRILAFPLVEVDRAVVLRAITVQGRYRLGFWDSQMIACAERFGADVLYSEDLSHSQRYGDVRCVNPFV
ncbi:MAG: PIN domain-containing protein [Hyphomicrobiales bacterium]|nr:PIN domain-containing protein [Hyphomicrobiales bacterium]MDE2017175.1 PIN domain-containing protein [Hyphomicrobiales bacterium]